MKFIKYLTLIAALIGSGHLAQAVQALKQDLIEWAFITPGLRMIDQQLLLTWYDQEAEVAAEDGYSSSEEDTEDNDSSSYDSDLEALYERCTNDTDYDDELHELIAGQEALLEEQDEEIAKLQAELAELKAQKENEGTSQDGLDLAAVERRAIDDFYESIDSNSEDESDSIDSEALEAELESLKAELAEAAKRMNKNA